MAQRLFGVDYRYRELDYKARRAMAVAIWDPEDNKESDSFRRRESPKIRVALAATMRRLDQITDTSETAGSPAVALGSAAYGDQLQTPWIERLEIRAETWLNGRGQKPYQTDWRYKDIARRPGVMRYALFRHANAVIRVEPLSDNIEAIEPRGIDNYGYQSWQVRFREELSQQWPTTWTARTVYAAPSSDVDEAEWLSSTVSHQPPKPLIKHITLIAHFDMRFPPRRVVKFVTPKATLPNLAGPLKEDVVVGKQGIARAEFHNGEVGRWMTHGLYWWPDSEPKA